MELFGRILMVRHNAAQVRQDGGARSVAGVQGSQELSGVMRETAMRELPEVIF